MSLIKSLVVVTSLLLASGCAATSMESTTSNAPIPTMPSLGYRDSRREVDTPRRDHEIESRRSRSTASVGTVSRRVLRETNVTRRF